MENRPTRSLPICSLESIMVLAPDLKEEMVYMRMDIV
jgi:hypothetical protein